MQLTSFEDLRGWFVAQQRDEKPATHWNLWGINYGETDKKVAFNTRVDGSDESFAFLESTIRQLNHPNGARFRLQTFPKGSPNNPTATVNVQIYEGAGAPAQAPAGIAGFGGIGDVQTYVKDQLQMARLQWENEDLRNQINSPSPGMERMLSLLAEVPGIGEVLKVAVAGLVTKLNPAAAPAVAAVMNGTPAAAGGPAADDDADPQATFVDNINAASASLGTDPYRLAARLKQLIQENPELAQSLLV